MFIKFSNKNNKYIITGLVKYVTYIHKSKVQGNLSYFLEIN